MLCKKRPQKVTRNSAVLQNVSKRCQRAHQIDQAGGGVGFGSRGGNRPRSVDLACSVCHQEDIVHVEDPVLISIADVSRAHFYADAVCNACVRLPSEDLKAKEPSVCGKLRKTMYRLWMLLNGGENITPGFWRREDFPEGWPVRAISSVIFRWTDKFR